jgi:hypothetical protein
MPATADAAFSAWTTAQNAFSAKDALHALIGNIMLRRAAT